MKRFILLVSIFLLFLSGCSTSDEAQFTLTPEEQQVTSTSLPATFTPTVVLPSATATPVPTLTATPEPSPTALPEIISAENARSIELVSRLGDGAVSDLALSPDGSQVLLLTTRSLQLYDVESGDLIWETPQESVQIQVVYSQDGSEIITSSQGGAVQRWDAASGEPSAELFPAVYNMEDIYLSSYGDYLATRDRADQTFVWDARSGEQLTMNDGLSFPFGVYESAVSPDGNYFLITGVDSKRNFQVQLWRVTNSRRYLRGLWGSAGIVSNLRFQNVLDSQYVTGLGTKVVHGTDAIFDLYIWNAANGDLLDTVDLTNDTTDYQIMGNNENIIAVRADGSIMKYSFRNNRGFLRDEIKVYDNPIVALSSSEDGSVFTTVDTAGMIKVWDLESLEELQSITISDDLSLRNLTKAYEYNLDVYEETSRMVKKSHYAYNSLSPDGTQIVRTAPDLHSVQIVDLASGDVLQDFRIEYGTYYAAPVFSPDGKTIAAALDDGQIIFWDVESGLDILRLTTSNKKQIVQMAYTKDGEEVAALSEGELLFWSPENRAISKSLAGNRIFAFSTDGALIASDNINKGIYLMDGETGKRITMLESEFAYALDFSPDSSLLAVGGYEFRSSIWEYVNVVYFIDLAINRRISAIELPGHAYTVMDVKYSADGSLLVSIDGYGSLFVWNPDTGSLLKKYEGLVVLPADIIFSPDGRKLYISNGDNVFHTLEIR